MYFTAQVNCDAYRSVGIKYMDAIHTRLKQIKLLSNRIFALHFKEKKLMYNLLKALSTMRDMCLRTYPDTCFDKHERELQGKFQRQIK